MILFSFCQLNSMTWTFLSYSLESQDNLSTLYLSLDLALIEFWVGLCSSSISSIYVMKSRNWKCILFKWSFFPCLFVCTELSSVFMFCPVWLNPTDTGLFHFNSSLMYQIPGLEELHINWLLWFLGFLGEEGLFLLHIHFPVTLSISIFDKYIFEW